MPLCALKVKPALTRIKFKPGPLRALKIQHVPLRALKSQIHALTYLKIQAHAVALSRSRWKRFSCNNPLRIEFPFFKKNFKYIFL